MKRKLLVIGLLLVLVLTGGCLGGESSREEITYEGTVTDSVVLTEGSLVRIRFDDGTTLLVFFDPYAAAVPFNTLLTVYPGDEIRLTVLREDRWHGKDWAKEVVVIRRGVNDNTPHS